MSNRRRAIMEIAKNGGRLPNEYQEVEYLESTGEQWIDTGVNLLSSDVVNCKFEMTSSTASLRDAIYGASADRLFFMLLVRSPITARVGADITQVTSTNYELNKIYDTSLTSGTYIENGVSYKFGISSVFTLSVSCHVMHRNQPNASPVSAKTYSFEIIGKFNGVPCYRKSDNKPGMYDLVNNIFHTNANTSASTDFTVGPNV